MVTDKNVLCRPVILTHMCTCTACPCIHTHINTYIHTYAQCTHIHAKQRKRKKMQISLIWYRLFKGREIYSFLLGEMQISPTSTLSLTQGRRGGLTLAHSSFSVSNDPSAVFLVFRISTPKPLPRSGDCLWRAVPSLKPYSTHNVQQLAGVNGTEWS